MSQDQKKVQLVLSDGSIDEAAATGNNAALHCKCARKLPLLGRSGLVSGATDGYHVICPDCKRRYFVVPEGKNQGRVSRVEEVV
jgi:hypothetical protein